MSDFATSTAAAFTVLAVLAAQSRVKVERDKAGRWAFRFEKEAVSDSVLAQLVGKLAGWLKPDAASK